MTLARRGHHSVALVLFGLTTHAVNLARAMVLLHRSGEPAGIPTLARQVIELGTTAVWVELCGHTAAEALMAEHSRQQLNELDGFAEIGMTGGDAARATVVAEKAWFLAHRSGRYFQQRCDELHGGPLIYAVYRAASEHSHASTTVVDSYLREPRTGSEAPVAFRSTPRGGSRIWMEAALTMLVHAWLAFDRLDTDRAARAHLRQIAAELGVGTRFQLSPEGSKAQRARERAERARRRQANTATGARVRREE